MAIIEVSIVVSLIAMVLITVREFARPAIVREGGA